MEQTVFETDVNLHLFDGTVKNCIINVPFDVLWNTENNFMILPEAIEYIPEEIRNNVKAVEVV